MATRADCREPWPLRDGGCLNVQTAPAMGRLAGEIKGRLDTGQDSKPPRCPQLKSQPLVQELQRRRVHLRRHLARLDALCVWRDDILDRIDRAKELQERGALFAQEQDDLIDAVRAWRLAAARVALDVGNADDMRRAVA